MTANFAFRMVIVVVTATVNTTPMFEWKHHDVLVK